MQNRPAKRKGGFPGLLLRLLGMIVLMLALSGCPSDDDQKGKPPNGGEPTDPCEGVVFREVSLEVDMSPSVSALDDWLDINNSGELKKAFGKCCTKFTEISAAWDSTAHDYPRNYADCFDKGQASWDMEYNASMHLILAMKIENADVFGYTWQRGPAYWGSSSWIFVGAIDSALVANNSGANRKAFGTREATHELGHHRAYLEDACYELNGEFYINSSHYNEDFEPDGDCVVASPLIRPNHQAVWSICGSDRSLLKDIYFCYACREAIKRVTWW